MRRRWLRGAYVCRCRQPAGEGIFELDDAGLLGEEGRGWKAKEGQGGRALELEEGHPVSGSEWHARHLVVPGARPPAPMRRSLPLRLAPRRAPRAASPPAAPLPTRVWRPCITLVRADEVPCWSRGTAHARVRRALGQVPIAKKAKTDEQGAQAKASEAEKGKDAHGDVGMAPADETAPAEPPSAFAAEVQEQPAASTAPAAPAHLSPRPAQKDFVNLVSPASSPSKAQPDAGQAGKDSHEPATPAAKRQCLPKDSAVGGESKPATIKEVKESPPAPSSADKDARLGMLRDELSGLGLVKLSGDAIPALRPSAIDMMNDFDLDAIRSEEVKPMSMKTRQVIARFLEGSARTIKEVAALLLVGAANKPSEDEESDCMVKIEESINAIAHLVERRPKISEGKVQGECAVKRWEVKDMADIPERFRALVETHRKMEVALCERIKLIETLVADLSSSKCKSTAKLDKSLVLMKDKYLKLEEKEKKERDKLEAKLEAERKKEQDKLEAKLEAERKKQQQREEKEKVKEAKAEGKEKDTEWSANISEKAETKTTKAKTCDKSETKTAKKSKKLEPTKGEASSIMSFFGKSAAASAPKSAVPHAHSTSDDKTSTACTHSQKERRNFHPWEKPKNAVVASFPFGPAAESNRKSRSAASADLASWLEVLRSETVRTVRQRPMREDGTPHPKMKLIQLNMKIPVVKTQLIDVDLEAEKKVSGRRFCPVTVLLPCSTPSPHGVSR